MREQRKRRLSIMKLIAEYNPFLLDIEYSTMRKNPTFLRYISKTKTAVLNHLDHKMPNFMKISGALGTCSLVEFAKAEPTGDNFENVVSVFESLYGKNPIKKRIS